MNHQLIVLIKPKDDDHGSVSTPTPLGLQESWLLTISWLVKDFKGMFEVNLPQKEVDHGQFGPPTSHVFFSPQENPFIWPFIGVKTPFTTGRGPTFLRLCRALFVEPNSCLKFCWGYCINLVSVAGMPSTDGSWKGGNSQPFHTVGW